MSEVVFKILMATVLSLGPAIDREVKGKSLGVKTMVTVSIISCMLTIVSFEASFLYAEAYSRPMDPGRLPSYIVSGIGFLGAGAILRKQNDVVEGLTTAAFVWGSAGIGIAVGAGFMEEAAVAVVTLMVSTKVLPWLLKRVGPKKLRERKITLVLTLDKEADVTKVLKNIKSESISLDQVRVKDLEVEEDHLLEVVGFIDEERYITDVYVKVKVIPYVKRCDVEGV
ncbi:MgtC/SapB family protein (plasmid) [Pontibacillus sp. ALD_SL1]|uniref:MgtC/SapB family protein n=1 Tax=Pontibacillus sp. ALD_SL1 TaxID=2777185 RepID=UPI001A96AE6E|nr:MgtC/SapB family protein [Pontibacillus sp. ALD_SL1]QST02839.1 MgtC/SapB family protein [Pontibacillus sp. ALD_SL1]